MKKVLLFLLLLPFAVFGQKVIPMAKPMVSYIMAGGGGTSNSGIGYFYAQYGLNIGQELWTVTDITRDADSIDIEINDTAYYRIIGDSSLASTNRTIVTAPSSLTTAPYGIAVGNTTTKIQSWDEDTDTLNWNSGGWLFEVKPGDPYGPELVTNGDFHDANDWGGISGWVITGGVAVLDDDDYPDMYPDGVSVAPGEYYHVVFTIVTISSGRVRIQCEGGGTGTGTNRTTTGTFTEDVGPVVGTGRMYFGSGSESNTSTIDNVSVKKIL